MKYFWRTFGGVLVFLGMLNVSAIATVVDKCLADGDFCTGYTLLLAGAVSGSFVLGHGMATILNGKWS